MKRSQVTVVPAAGVDRVVKEVRAFGLQYVETGGFLMMPRDTATVTVVACAGEVGIVRRHNMFQISERALDRLFTFADDRGLWAPVQFHSHQFGAFLSRTDKEHGLCVEGFTSVVLPAFTDPPVAMDQWGWWTFTGGEWVTVLPASIVVGDVTAIRFDEEGVREH